MIPLSLITGFLGAGKTTYLEHLVEQYRGRRVLFLVNEFSPMDVDGTRLDLPEEKLVPISGGSIFCKCKVNDFIKVLRDILCLKEPPEGVVIEATGIANPKVIQQMLKETYLQNHFGVASIVSVVDPESFRKLVRTLPNIIAQIEAADTVLVNKVDLHEEDALLETETLVRGIKADATILRTERCKVDLDLFGSVGLRALEGDYAECIDPNYCKQTIELPDAVDWPALKEALVDLGESLYRAKGYVATGDGSLLSVDYSSSGWEEEAVSVPSVKAGLVLICHGTAESATARLQEKIRNRDFSLSCT